MQKLAEERGGGQWSKCKSVCEAMFRCSGNPIWEALFGLHVAERVYNRMGGCLALSRIASRIVNLVPQHSVPLSSTALAPWKGLRRTLLGMFPVPILNLHPPPLHVVRLNMNFEPRSNPRFTCWRVFVCLFKRNAWLQNNKPSNVKGALLGVLKKPSVALLNTRILSVIPPHGFV